MAQVKAVAWELPSELGLPISRFSRAELHRLVIERAMRDVSAATIARSLAEDALKPWQQRSWVFPRDPRFLERAGPVLDLCQRRAGQVGCCTLASTSSVPTRRPKSRPDSVRYRTVAPSPGHGQRVEHDYDRRGGLCYLAAWDVHHGRLFGRCEQQTGIVPFARLIEQVMSSEPYVHAKRVFWIVDNGSSHRGQKAVERFQAQWPRCGSCNSRSTAHGSTRSRSSSPSSSARCSPRTASPASSRSSTGSTFEHHYNQIAEPFDWTFTRADLQRLIARVATHEPRLQLAA